MDLFGEQGTSPQKKKSESTLTSAHQPLATRMRPGTVDEFVGQEHLLSEGKLLRRAIESKRITSSIFYGPPSSGKTTLAHIISNDTNLPFQSLNAVLDGVKELRSVIDKAEKHRQIGYTTTILFVDEIHRWNKAQQDALLPHIESGLLTLIGATTENPFYSLVGPLLSRAQLFELYAFDKKDVELLLQRAIEDKERGIGGMNVKVDPEAIHIIAEKASGDIRHALNALEMAALSTKESDDGARHITVEEARQSIQARKVRYDRSGDEHYHYASAFIKSMRGSDPDAALYWMTAMLQGGEDPMFIFRRMYIFASEDVGLADPHALTLVHSAQMAFERCGMPEGWYFLSHACLYLSLAPKSNSTSAVFKVHQNLENEGVKPVPDHLKDKTANKLEAQYVTGENPSDDYKYPHSYPGHWIDQQYLPDALTGTRWFKPGKEGREAELKDRLDKLRKSVKSDSANE